MMWLTFVYSVAICCLMKFSMTCFIGCPNSCPGLGFCVGVEVCCSYYDGDNCTDDCGNGRFADETTNYTCTCINRNLTSPDCIGK